ncbi:MAG: fumarylacetoacetate hydrolase family protein [Bacillota bacterium]
MKLANFRWRGRTGVGIETPRGICDFSRANAILHIARGDFSGLPLLLCSTDQLLSMGGDLVALASEVASFIERHDLYDELMVPTVGDRGDDLDAAKGDSAMPLPPVLRPSKIIGIGRNYVQHAREGGYYVPEEPIYFAKAPSSIVGTGHPVVYHTGLTRVDPEIELGVVIGRTCRAATEAEALDYVAGYTVVNDVSARDLQEADLKKYNPWFRSKSYDTFTPIGPFLTLKDEIPDPHNVEMTLRVNGEVRQHDTTAHMIFGVPKLIAYISEFITLLPGDVIATGTPHGIAPVFVGDVMEASIPPIGTLVNKVVAPEG